MNMTLPNAHCALALALLMLTFGAQNAAAVGTQSPMVGFWSCSGQQNGVTLVSTYDYRDDGTYVSTQNVTVGALSFSGGGGGTYRYENGMLSDTKQRATIDRVVHQGVELGPDSPVWQELERQSRSNIGMTTTGAVRIERDVAYAGGLTCSRRQR